MLNDTAVFHSTGKTAFPLLDSVLQYSLTECYINKLNTRTRSVKNRFVAHCGKQAMVFFGKLIFILFRFTENKGCLRLGFRYRLTEDNKRFFCIFSITSYPKWKPVSKITMKAYATLNHEIAWSWNQNFLIPRSVIALFNFISKSAGKFPPYFTTKIKRIFVLVKNETTYVYKKKN